MGHRRRLAPARHVRLLPSTSGTPAASSWPATGWASSRSTSRRRRAGCASPRRSRAAARGRGRHLDRPGRAAPLPDLARRRPGAADDPERRPQAAAGDGAGDRGRRVRQRAPLLGAALRARPSIGWSARDWEDAIEDALRAAVRRRLVADIPVGVLLSGGLDLQLIVGLLAQEGQTGLATYSIGFETVGGHGGRRVRLLGRHRRALRHRPPPDPRGPDELAPGRLAHAIGAMAEPMVSHDVVAFDLLSERVGAARSGWCSRGRAPTRCSPATTGTRRWPGSTGRPRSRVRERFFDRDHEAMGGSSPTGTPPTRTRAWPSSAGTCPPPARRPRWTPRCGSTARSCSSTTR